MLFNKEKLNNLLYCKQILRWKKSGWLTDEHYSSLLTNLVPRYKTTNVFLRIGLFLLTFIVCFCSMGLLALMFSVDNQSIISVFCLLGGVGLYLLFRMVAQDKSWYANGIDDAVTYISISMIITGICIFTSDLNHIFDFTFPLLISVIITAIAVFLTADRFVAVCSYLLLIGFIFYLSIQISPYANLFLPFLIMAISLFCWWLLKKGLNNFALLVYHDCFEIVQLLTLITFYLAGNYFVIHEAGISFFNSDVTPMAWLFWIFTVTVPFVYIVLGLKNKNRGFLNTGLILLVAAGATIRYYHSVLPLEIALILIGSLLLFAGWFLLRKLKEPQNGFTKEEDKAGEFLIHPNLEAIIVAQVMTPEIKQPDENKIDFGGGKFGGGGAGGEI